MVSFVVDLLSIGGQVSILQCPVTLLHEAFDGLLSLFHHLNHVGVQKVDHQIGTENGDQGSEENSHGSVAIRDVPSSSPGGVRGRDATLTNRLAMHCLALQLFDVGCHHLLAEVILSSGVVHEKHAVVDWFEWFVFHVLSIGHRGDSATRRGPVQ